MTTNLESIPSPAGKKDLTAICILGMHRSGTSCVARAMNLLGVYLGNPNRMEAPGPDNPKGFWEHRDIRMVQQRLLAGFNRTWDTAHPLPAGWEKTELVLPLKQELAGLVGAEFSNHPLWGWKDPQTCLLLPLWREVLQSLQTRLACVFMVRNPADVAESLATRNGLPFSAGLGIWFHYNLVALRDAAGLPVVYLSYEKFLAQWETELRRSAAALNLAWPGDEADLRKQMDGFVDPNMRHNQTDERRLRALPTPVQELYRALSTAAESPVAPGENLPGIADRLYGDFQDYSALFEPIPKPPRRNWPSRTLHRWQRSIGKRLHKTKP